MRSLFRPRALACALLMGLAAACTPQGQYRFTPAPSGAGHGVPVLAWHYFAEQPDSGASNLVESYARYEEMLKFLQRHGFKSVFPEEVRPGDDRSKMVVLTFDDGPAENLRAAEMLERYGFRGIFFVIPNRTAMNDPRNLDSAGVATLAARGHRVAPHGYAHRSLATSGTEVAASLVRSPKLISRQAPGTPVDADFAYPFGHYTAEVTEALAGSYRYLHTVDPGYWDGLSPLLPRMLIMRDVDLALYQEYVLGGGRYQPTLRPLSASGGVGDSVAFVAERGGVPRNAELFAISADAQGRSYTSQPLGDNLRVRGDTAWVKVGAHMRRHFPAGRNVVSYALIVREEGRIRYLTPGLIHWVRDPALPPLPASPPPAAPGQ